MVGDLLEGVAGGILRFFGRAFTEIFLEILVRGVGYFFCRIFSKNVNPESAFVLFIGLLIWTAVIFGGYKTYNYVNQHIAVDKCLDSGGHFNYSKNTCEFN